MVWKIPVLTLSPKLPLTPSPLTSVAVQKAENLLAPVTKYFLYTSETRLNILSVDFFSLFITRISLAATFGTCLLIFSSCTQSAWHHLLREAVGSCTYLLISFLLSRMPNLSRQSRQIKTPCVQFIWHIQISVVQVSECFYGWKLEPGLTHLYIDIYTRLV